MKVKNCITELVGELVRVDLERETQTEKKGLSSLKLKLKGFDPARSPPKPLSPTLKYRELETARGIIASVGREMAKDLPQNFSHLTTVAKRSQKAALAYSKKILLDIVI